MAKDRSRGIIGIFFLIVVLFVIFLFFAFYTVMNIKRSSDMGSVDLFDKKHPIAVVSVEGVIMESKKTIENLMIAEKDDSIKAIIVRIESPGGAVGPTQEIYHEIKRIDEKVKPVYASFGSVAASGGYYLGAAARKIFTNPGSLTGSIGVVMQFADMSKLYEFIKIDPQTIKAGKYKDVGSPFRPMKPNERKLLDSMLEKVHQQFISDIMLRRGDRVKGDIREYAQGQIFSGEGAYEVGLVDELGSLWQAGRKIQEELNIKGEFGLRYIKRKEKFSLRSLVDGIEESVQDLSTNVLGKFMVPMLMFRM